jgi:hypothetical protein
MSWQPSKLRKFVLQPASRDLHCPAYLHQNRCDLTEGMAVRNCNGHLQPVAGAYPQDINLKDVFFISADDGWVVGEHSTILHTTDGKTRKAEVGGSSLESKTTGQIGSCSGRAPCPGG